jgi:hypothetical protein
MERHAKRSPSFPLPSLPPIAEMTTVLPVAAMRGPRRMPSDKFGTSATVTGLLNVSGEEPSERV